MDTIRIALGCTPTCIALKAISTTPIIGIDRRAANQRRTNHRRNGMKSSRRCSDTAARSLDHSVPARPADLTTLPQRINSLPIKPCKASGGGWSVASDRENSNGREPLNAIPPCVTDQVGNRFDRQGLTTRMNGTRTTSAIGVKKANRGEHQQRTNTNLVSGPSGAVGRTIARAISSGANRVGFLVAAKTRFR